MVLRTFKIELDATVYSPPWRKRGRESEREKEREREKH